MANFGDIGSGLTSSGHGLPAPQKMRSEGARTLRAGFIPLVDASVLIAACEFGFARSEGLTLDLVKDVSWANVRDRLAFRQFDIAHMLSPCRLRPCLDLAPILRRRSRPSRSGVAVMPSRCPIGSLPAWWRRGA